MFGKYYLAISKEASTPERLCSHISHEMYHRVTAGRKGLAGQMWVQEVMACLTSDWFLRNQSFEGYADYAKEYRMSTTERADVQAIRACRRQKSRDWVFRGKSVYPDGFGASVYRTGYALISLLDGNDLCRIVKAATLEEWITSLPLENQYGVCKVLEIPTVGKIIPETGADLSQLRRALTAKGSSEVVVAEFQQISQLQPENGTVFFYLGRAYEQSRQPDMALDAYLKADALNFSDAWVPFNIGGVYWHRGDWESAAPWFCKASERKPEWAQAHYFLGCSSNKLGNIGAAHQSWEKVLTLDDEHYTELAQAELAGNPLPPEAAQN